MAEGCCSQSHRILPQQTNPNQSHIQMTRSSQRHVEPLHHAHKEDFSFSHCPTWPEPTYPSTGQSHPNEAVSSIRGKRKRRQKRGFPLSNAMRVRLGPQDQQTQAPLCISNALKAQLGQLKQEVPPSF